MTSTAKSKPVKLDDMMKTRTITMDDEHHRKGRIIAANLGIENLSALFRHFIDKEWTQNYSHYEKISLPKTE